MKKLRQQNDKDKLPKILNRSTETRLPDAENNYLHVASPYNILLLPFAL